MVINDSKDQLVALLKEGKRVIYRDGRFPSLSGGLSGYAESPVFELRLQLNVTKSQLFYVQLPDGYTLPDQLKNELAADLNLNGDAILNAALRLKRKLSGADRGNNFTKVVLDAEKADASLDEMLSEQKLEIAASPVLSIRKTFSSRMIGLFKPKAEPASTKDTSHTQTMSNHTKPKRPS